jgi:hypothetical protein
MTQPPRPAVLLPATALLVLLAGLPGCGTMEKDRQASALLATADGYREALRWGYWEAALEFLHPGALEGLDLKPLENVRVTGIEVLRPGDITPDDRALRLVRIDYVREDEQRVERVVDNQDWRWDDTRKAWLLHSGLPSF